MCDGVKPFGRCDFYFDKGERRPRGEGFVLMLDLVPQVLFYSFLLKHLLLALGAEQHAGGNCNGDGVLGLGLKGGQNRDVTEHED